MVNMITLYSTKVIAEIQLCNVDEVQGKKGKFLPSVLTQY